MICTRLEGGLGNTMFQYALGRHLSLKNKTDLKFEISSCWVNPLGDYSLSMEAFNIEIKKNILPEKDLKRFRRYVHKPGKKWFIHNMLFSNKEKYIKEKHYYFDPLVLEKKDDTFLHGWWQSDKYFKNIRTVILNDFTVKTPEPRNVDITQKIISSTGSIALHIRRLDYVKNPETHKWFGELTYNYYKQGLEYITEMVKKPTLFVFSDDIMWVKDNMSFPFETIYVSGNINSPHEDIRLMSLCKHQIIANSSFSWWGAWLNNNPKKIVIAPKQWFANAPKNKEHDLIPKEWIRIEN